MRAGWVVFAWGVLAGCVLMTFVGCDDDWVEVTEGAAKPLPACAPAVAADHYCQASHATAACWDISPLVAGVASGDANARAAGAGGCTVETHPSAGVTATVECVPGCNGPAVPLPAVTITGNPPITWCHGLDAQGLEQAVCGAVGYLAYAYPPFVLHCVAVCP